MMLLFSSSRYSGGNARSRRRLPQETSLKSGEAAYNFAKRLKTLRGLTPHEYVCKSWKAEPVVFEKDPTQLTPGLYT